MLKLIQLGLTFSDAEGRLPRCNGELCVWQFNFRYARWKLCSHCICLCTLQAIKQALAGLRRSLSYGSWHCHTIAPIYYTCAINDHAWGCACTWLVLLCREFKLSEDMYAHDSIDLLKDSGIDFARNEAQGIDVQRFGELLISSGIVLNDEVSWQHGAWAVCPHAACILCRVSRESKTQ